MGLGGERAGEEAKRPTMIASGIGLREAIPLAFRKL
jgi:hypothetical protein